MKELKEMFENLTPNQKIKLKECKTVQEILGVAKVEEIVITPEQAEIALKLIAQPHEQLSDDEIEKVTGGYNFSIGARAL
ncbi:hypothetical protein ACS3UN_12890 [Oscillospiraceae bacterium LTW-04]|nr:hypothetical protein RBH76_00700 [Oscillospiraceae bacterium MB24-C1]